MQNEKPMISYITLGSNDLSASAAFYDAVFGAVGGKRKYSLDHMIGYGFGSNTPMILVQTPYNGEAASFGNGTMIALQARDRAHVDAVHVIAMQQGGADEGAPGPRGERFYGGYFRDLDGNKFNICVMS